MTIDLAQLLRAAGIAVPGNASGISISRVVHDSRVVSPGDLFVALPGHHVDGTRYIDDAIGRGAVAVVTQAPGEDRHGDDRHGGTPASGASAREIGSALSQSCAVPVAVVSDARAALSPLAAAAAGHPSRRLTVAGVTGTDGKTTTTTLLWAAWRGGGFTPGCITTVDIRSGETIRANLTRQTTPEASDLQQHLVTMLLDGCTHVALEASSHALELHRIDDIELTAAVYTKITSEHLDFHGNREAYFHAKSRLLAQASLHQDGLAQDGLAILDRDDAFGFPRLRTMAVPRRLTYSAAGSADADLVAERIHADGRGVAFTARTPWGTAPIQLQLVGRFNVANCLAALAAACGTGAGFDGAIAGVEALDRVDGRMERVDAGQPFAVVIDYAHTAEALATVLAELREATTGRLWVVFGSAGERDREKRPAMGRIAAELCDRVVVTDEDPREEDARSIMEAIAEGGVDATHRLGEEIFIIPGREAAIRFAISHAEVGDCVLLAGKGHETSIIVGQELRPWNERDVAEAAVGDASGGNGGMP